jgi:altronate dehydratase small subunit
MMIESDKSIKRCFQVNPSDNVATLLDDVYGGPLTVCGAAKEQVIYALEVIALGHKIALNSVAYGAPIIKYGVPIALSTVDILPGEWVHLHNCRSQIDERSSDLDVTGIAKDTPYV